MDTPIATPQITSVAATARPARVAIAFQGGSFLAGAIAAGTVDGLMKGGAFRDNVIRAFSGTSAGALVAMVCWRLTLQGRMDEAPDVLRRQWLHNAYGIIPNQTVADNFALFDRMASSTNPLYAWAKDALIVPVIHGLFEQWIDQYIEPATCLEVLYHKYIEPNRGMSDKELKQLYDHDNDRPHVVIGATRVSDSRDTTFTDEDFFNLLIQGYRAHPGDLAEAISSAAAAMRRYIMTSGSLDWITGMTTIDEGPYAGTYLDGAWAKNPPLNELLEPLTTAVWHAERSSGKPPAAKQTGQIWLMEVFPRVTEHLPRNFAEREDRREELWQNAVVEQQREFIKKVNRWVDAGLNLKLRAGGPPSTRHYRHVDVRTITLPASLQPLTAGARLVNSPAFLCEMMDMGRANALRFLTLPMDCES